MIEQQLHEFQQNELISEFLKIEHDDFRWEKLNVFMSSRVNKGKTWAKAFFVECTEDFFNDEYQFSVKECEELQSSLLGKDFFSEKTSLRWNYYLYFVYVGKNLPKGVDKNTIEEDTHYARKRFVSLDELDGLLKLTDYSSQDKELPDPESEWLNILEPQGLSGCLQIDKYSASVSSFLENGIPIGNINNFIKSTGPAKSQENLNLVSIKELCTQEYRKEIFGNKMCTPFKMFNLIEGENGSGKSSIIDAVEFALTGSIKRLTDSNGVYDGGVSYVNAETKTHESMVFYSNGSPKIKDREQAWYNTPITKVNPSISEKFGQMNRFSIESVFSLVNSQCRDKDGAIQNSITTLCFGDSLALMQKNWVEYKKRFTAEQDRGQKALQTTRIDQSLNLNRLRALQVEIQVRQVDISQLYYDLFGETPKDEDYKKLEDIYRRYTNEISAFTAIPHSLSYAQLQYLDTQQKDDVAALTKKTDQFKSQQVLCQKKQATYKANESEMQKLTGQISLYSDLLCDAKDLIRQLASNNISEDQIDNITTEYRALKSSFEYLLNNYKQFWESFSEREIIFMPQIETRLEEFRKGILVFKENIIDLTNKERALEAKKSSAELNMNRIQKLQTELLQYGQTIAAENNLSDCPLCGQPYGNVIALQAKIQELTQRCGTPAQGQLSSLLEELSSIQMQLRTHEKEFKQLGNEEKFLKELMEVLKLCGQTLNMQNCKQVKDILTLLEDAEIKNNQSLRILDSMQSSIVALRNGFSNIGIPICSLLDYIEVSETTLLIFPQQVKELMDKQNSLLEEILKLDAFILENVDLEESLCKAIHENQQLTKVLSAFKVLLSANMVLTPDTDLLMLKNNLLKLEGVVKVIAENSEISSIANKLKQLEVDVSRQEAYLKRCDSAIDALSKMKSLSDYSQSFIDENLQQIAILFKKLHLPPEFTDLKRVADEIVICRPDSDDFVHINQMSMGQRTSLALAILFQMHIMGKSTPRILLLDEPISNLDDVHIMNMVDMLRELTLNGAQVFITTASNEIARYLERKFAFMQDEMVHYKLKREVNGGAVGKTMITLKTVPYLIEAGEEGISN